MAIVYRIYANDGRGGPIDYDLPVATTSETTFELGPIPPGSDLTYAVRAYDEESGIEESNTHARVRIHTDAAGEDLGGRPAALIGPAVRRAPGRQLAVAWLCPKVAGVPPADGFRVYVATEPGATPDRVAATVPYRDGQSVYRVVIADEGYRSLTILPFNANGERVGEPILPLNGPTPDARLSAAELIDDQ